MHLLCPHCRNPIELLEVPPEVSCPACGSTFRLDEGATAAWAGGRRQVGRFELLESVGSGAFGTVYKARDPELDRIVAIKVPRAGNLPEASDWDRFLREARSVAQLRFPSIVSVHEVGQADGLPYLVSDFVQGVTLADLLTSRRLAFTEAARLIAAVADALQYAHAHGVVHRDIKPSNIMLGDDGAPFVMDFGLAKRDAGEVTMTMDGQVLGTPAYMSPEQAAGRHHQVDGRSDVYSLAVVFYQLLTGELPFRGNARMLLHQVLRDEPRPPHALNDRIPRDLETICLKAMAKEPARRYGSARDFADDLRRYERGEPIHARPTGRLERGWRWCRRNPAAATAAALSVVVLLGSAAALAALAFMKSRHAEQVQIQSRKLADEQGRTLEALKESQAQLRRAHHESADLALDRGQRLCEQGEAAHGLLWLGQALRHAEKAGDVDLEGAVRANLGGWAQQVHPLRQTLRAANSVYAVAFRADGKQFLTGGADGAAQVWETGSGQAVGPACVKPFTNIRAVVFTDMGKPLAAAVQESRCTIWEVTTGKSRAAIVHPGKIETAVFGPDGRTILVGGHDRTARLWDAETGEALGPALQHDDLVSALALSKDGQTALIGGHGRPENIARLRNPRTGEAVGPELRPDSHLYAAAISPDGKFALTGGYGETAQLWDLATGTTLGQPLHHKGWVQALAFSSDSRLALTGSLDGETRFWDVATSKPVGAPMVHGGTIRAVAFSPDDRLALTGSSDGCARIWERNSRGASRLRLEEPGWIYTVLFEPRGPHLVTLGATNAAQLWDGASGKPVRRAFPHFFGGPKRGSFTPDGRSFVTIKDQTAYLWDVATGKLLGEFAGHKDVINNLAISADGSRLLTVANDGGALVWDTSSRAMLGALKPSPYRLLGAAISPDGRLAFTGADAQRLGKLWDLATLKVVTTLEGHRSAVTSGAFAPDGKTIVTGSLDGTAQLWDVAGGQAVGRPLQHQAPVYVVAFSPSGKTVMTGSWDRTARFWHAASSPIGPPLQHQGKVLSVAFSTDGSSVLTGGEDKSARLWAAPMPVTQSLPEIVGWLESITGMTLDDKGTLRVLPLEEWRTRHAGEPGALATGGFELAPR